MGLKNNAVLMKQDEILEENEFFGHDISSTIVFTSRLQNVISTIHDNYKQFETICDELLIKNTTICRKISYDEYTEYIKVVGINIDSSENYLKDIVRNSSLCEYAPYFDICRPDIYSVKNTIEGEYNDLRLNGEKITRTFSNKTFRFYSYAISLMMEYFDDIDYMLSAFSKYEKEIHGKIEQYEKILQKINRMGSYHKFNASVSCYKSILDFLKMWSELFSSLVIVIRPICDKLKENIDEFLAYSKTIWELIGEAGAYSRSSFDEKQFNRELKETIRYEYFEF